MEFGITLWKFLSHFRCKYWVLPYGVGWLKQLGLCSSECFGDVLGEIRITCPTAFRCALCVRRGGRMSWQKQRQFLKFLSCELTGPQLGKGGGMLGKLIFIEYKFNIEALTVLMFDLHASLRCDSLQAVVHIFSPWSCNKTIFVSRGKLFQK